MCACVLGVWGGYLKYLFSYAVWDEVCSQPCEECAQCVPSSINLSNNHYCVEQRQKHSMKSAASFNISRRDPHFGVRTHTHDSDSFGVHITTFVHCCAEKLFTLQLLQRSKKAQKKQRVRVSWIILRISNALSTKHDNYKSSKGPQGKINPKSDSCIFCLNSNENIGFVESLKSDLRWQSKQSPAAADHSNWCQQRPFITTVPSQTVSLLYMNVRGQMFQTQEGWWGMICTGNISVWARFYNTWPVL